MIFISVLLMIILFIVAGITQFWLLAMIGVGLFAATILMYLMSTNDVFAAIVIILAAIGVPILYLHFEQSWILYISYIAIGLWINAGAITDNDVYSYWTIEGKIYKFWDEHATDFLIKLFSFLYAALWAGLAFIGTKIHQFLLIPSLYLIIRSIIVLVNASKYSLSHSFMLFDDIKDSFSSFSYKLKRLFSGSGYGRRFSWLSILFCVLTLGLSIGLSILETYNIYSDFVLRVANNGPTLLENSKWYVISKWIMEDGFAWVETLTDNLLTLLLVLPAGALMIVLFLAAGALETVLSLLWYIICLFCSLLIGIAAGFLGYVLAPLFVLVLILLTVLTFAKDYSILNRLFAILCTILSLLSCIYFFMVYFQ